MEEEDASNELFAMLTVPETVTRWRSAEEMEE